MGVQRETFKKWQNKITTKTFCLTLIRVVRQNSLLSVQNLRMVREIESIVKHNNYWSFASETHQSSTSGQSFISRQLRMARKIGIMVKHNSFRSSVSDMQQSSRAEQSYIGIKWEQNEKTRKQGKNDIC